ncbi:hypothetical protein [Streptomyces sp. NPDC102437]|uniref:zinc finger domain-containing protein n=1 Tax=Streptomyces sp. NPDC102437 TaxID=3366175 RepID=UPI003822C349
MISYEQAGELLGLAAARDQRTVGDADILAWHDDLNTARISYADARHAISHFYAVHIATLKPADRWRITPVDIIDITRRARRERLENFRYESPGGDADPHYLARLRGQLTATADGARPAAIAIEGSPRPALRAALASIGRRVPDEETSDEDTTEESQPASPLSVDCPQCRARLGQHCKKAGRTQLRPHPARVRVANGEPAYDPDAEQAAEQRRAAAAAYLDRLTDAERAELAVFKQQMKGVS